MTPEPELETQIEAALRGEVPDPLPVLAALYERHRALERLLDRLTRISDRFQDAERARGQDYAQHYQRKVRQIEKIVRISDQYQMMLRDLNGRLHRLSAYDELTALPNRRQMRERIQAVIATSERDGRHHSLGLADIDHFKSINDQWGHAVGDTVLARTAQVMQEAMREGDLCGRWGGEEFLILFSGADAAEAGALADRLRRLVAAEDPTQPQVTVSIGVTALRPGEPFDEILKRADTALYEAKAAGRDRVVLG